VIDDYREKGVKVGLLKPRLFRPFPNAELAEALAGKKVVGVMDRSASFGGFGGPLFTEIRSALYGRPDAPEIHNWIYGLGGRDLDLHQVGDLIDSLVDIAAGKPKDTVNLLGVRL